MNQLFLVMKEVFFFESYNKKDFQEIGILDEFVQDNHSKSRKGVLRGLHFQTEHSQGKLIRIIKGGVLDIAVDLRRNSKTFGKNIKVELTEENKECDNIQKLCTWFFNYNRRG